MWIHIRYGPTIDPSRFTCEGPTPLHNKSFFPFSFSPNEKYNYIFSKTHIFPPLFCHGGLLFELLFLFPHPYIHIFSSALALVLRRIHIRLWAPFLSVLLVEREIRESVDFWNIPTRRFNPLPPLPPQWTSRLLRISISTFSGIAYLAHDSVFSFFLFINFFLEVYCS